MRARRGRYQSVSETLNAFFSKPLQRREALTQINSFDQAEMFTRHS